jgi:protocatechuate 3,4-dioxygenase alpha subunit
VPTRPDGSFTFTTIKPGAVPGPGNSLQAPHLNLTIFMRGQLKRLVTRVYFDGESANASDPVLALVDDPARRATLVARKDGAGVFRFDIVLQGAGETVFFDC